MKRTNLSFAIAALSSITPEAVGIASLKLTTKSSSDGWCRLLPSGYFKAVDGRPTDVPGGQWFLDAQSGQALVAQLKAQVNDTVIDYEHQTLLAEENGQPAPASGWFKDAEWREDGLWIKPKWTPKARDFISNEEYQFLSAVFPYDKTTGKPLSIHSAALVNRPGLDGVTAVALRSLITPVSPKNNTQQESAMDPVLEAALKALGLDENATPEQVEAAVQALKDKQAAAEGEVAALKARTTNGQAPDPAQYVPIAVLKEMQGQIASLSAQSQQNEVAQLIADAKKDGRLLPASEAWARDLGKTNVAALKEFLGTAPSIAALKGQQAGHEKPPATTAGQLTEEEKTVARLTGRTESEFAALKAKA
jgi:phage I-like protein